MHQYASNVLKLPSSQTKLHSIGLTKSPSFEMSELSWYRVCVNNVFQPSEYLSEVIDSYLKQFEGRFVVGVHARMGNLNANWHESTVFLKMNSVVQQLPKIRKTLQKEDSRVFLSTDSDKVEALFRRQFKDSLILVDSLPRMHVGKGVVKEAGVMRSFIDLYLLGQCNVLYLTPNSGFSHVGLAMNTKNTSVLYM